MGWTQTCRRRGRGQQGGLGPSLASGDSAPEDRDTGARDVVSKEGFHSARVRLRGP